MRVRKQISRKKRDASESKAKKMAKTFVGTCSKCRGKNLPVVRFHNAQLCINGCLPAAIARLGGSQNVGAGEVITAS